MSFRFARHLTRRLSITLLLTILVVSALTRIVSAGLATLPEKDGALSSSLPRGQLLCPPSPELSDLLEQIARRNDQLETREREVALREQDMSLARQEIAASLSRLQQAEDSLEKRMHQSSTASEDDITRLVDVYQRMKPKEAAVLFEAMEPTFAAGFLSRIRPDAASAIFSNLSPETAYALSILMAGRNANAATE